MASKFLINSILKHRLLLYLFGTVLLALLVTYPVALKINSTILAPWGDNAGTLWWFWWFKETWARGQPWQYVNIVGSPFGFDASAIPFQYPHIYYAALLSSLLGEVVAFNIIVLTSFPLSALTMYALAHHITGNRTASMISGLIYAFAPYHIARLYGHIVLANIQWMPLYLLCLLRFYEKTTLSRGLVAGLAFALVALENYYYGYLMAITTVLFVIMAAARWALGSASQQMNRGTFKALVLAGLSAILPITFFAYPIIRNIVIGAGEPSSSFEYAREPSDLATYSAKWYSYLLPPVYHPFFGGEISRIHASLGDYDFVEQTEYLGYVPIALSLFGLAFSIRRRPPHKRFTVLFVLVMALVTLLFSIGPYINIGPWHIPMPSLFASQLLPIFRSYARFGIVVMLAISLLAGLGMAYIMLLIGNRWVRRTSVTVILLAVAFEFANSPGAWAGDVNEPPEVYRWLAAQPGDFTISEHPLLADPSNYILWQRFHNKKLFNGGPQGSKADWYRQWLFNLSDSQVPSILGYLGIRYLIVHTDKYFLPSIEPKPDLSAMPSELRLVKTFDSTYVYDLVADSALPILLYGSRFYGREGNQEGQTWRWVENAGELWVINPKEKSSSTMVTFEAWSFYRPRTLQVMLNGERIMDVTVPAGPLFDSITFPLLLPRGESKLTFFSPEGTQEIDSIEHNGDHRQVSVALRDLKIMYD